MNRSIVRAAFAAVSLILLSGCGQTLQERIDDREKCHDAGGVYHESGMSDPLLGDNYWCDLSDKAGSDQ